MTRIDFRVVGEFELLVGEIRVPLGSPRRRALLAVLLACGNETILASSLIAELWPSDPPPNALANLRTYASELRREMPAEVAARIATRHGGYQLRVQAGELDVWRLREQYGLARAALDRGDAAAAITGLEPLQPKLATGEVFPGVTAGSLLEAARAGFSQECRIAREAYFEACILAGTRPDVVGHLRAHVGRHLLDEHGYALLMTALSQAGQNAAALEVYQQARRLLIDELGIEPGTELAHLQQAILSGDSRPGAVRTGAVPPAVRYDAVRYRPFQLPPDLPDFAGRSEAVKNVVELLSGGSSGAWPAVASITGMPGTGKSTVAVHVAHRLRGEFADGQIYLDLGGDDLGTVDPHDALGQVLTGLGVSAGAIPATSAERTAMLRSLSADRRLLFVLDNATTAEHVLPLLPANSGCGLLVTSRSRVMGLHSWPQVELAPLGPGEGVELLARIVGADRVRADTEAASRVVDLCAGLPLAIRIAGTRLVSRPHQSIGWLAAGWMTSGPGWTSSPSQGLPCAAASTWSIAVLMPSCSAACASWRRLTCRTSARGPRLWRSPDSIREAEDIVDGLVQARLLTAAAGRALDVPRFRFHQLVRLYVREVAATVDQAALIAAVSRAYAACLSAAARMDQRLRDYVPLVTSDRSHTDASLLADLADPADWFATEHAALVAAVHGAAGRGWHDLTWDLALTLQRFFEAHHHFRDWQEVATVGLRAARASGNRVAQAALLCSLGELHLVQDQHDRAATEFDSALDLLPGAGPGGQRARARAVLGMCIVHAGRGQLAEVGRRRAVGDRDRRP